MRVLNDPLTAFAFRAMGNRPDAQDIVQAAFIKAWKKWATIRRMKNFSQQRAYLYQAVTWEILQLKRRAYRRRESAGIEVVERIAASDYSLEDRQVLQDELTLVWQDVCQLPRECREATVLYAAGYEYDQIAEMLDVSRSTVRSHVSKARQELRQARDSREDGLP